MYRFVLLLAGLALLVASRDVAAATQSPPKATLQLVDRSPLTVRGAHFKLRERVRVTASTDNDTATRVARTTRRGVFSVDFGTLGKDPCATITIKAAGAKGDRATLVVKPPPPIDSAGPCRPV
jgi:hypothetical protein